MKHSIAIAQMFVIAALAILIQTVAVQDPVLADSPLPGETTSQLLHSGGGLAPSGSASSSYFRDIPSISGHYSIGEKTLLPYLGAGFSGGYSSEVNRSLSGAPPTQVDLGFRNQFGQNVSPNEFQLGVRIPF